MSTVVGESVDAGMDAVQRRLMFEDEYAPNFSHLCALCFVVYMIYCDSRDISKFLAGFLRQHHSINKIRF